MKLLPAYVSYGFLEELSKGAQVNLLDVDAALDIKSKAELVQLILNGLSINIDMTFEEIDHLLGEKKCNQLLTYLIGAHGKKRLECKPKDFAIIENKKLKQINPSPFTQFFLSNNSTNEFEQLEGKTGFLFHDIKMPLTYQRLSQFRTESFNKGDKKDWSFVHQYQLPHHSIVIVDPYLINNSHNEHVVQLIRNLISPSLTSLYYITLFFSTSGIKKFEDKAATLIPNKIAVINTRLKELIKNTQIVLEWVVVRKEENFHDRFIITNNNMIYSGHGFELIEVAKATKQTSWVIINHAKIQDENNGNIKTHFNTAVNCLTHLKKWIITKEIYSCEIIKNPLLKL